MLTPEEKQWCLEMVIGIQYVDGLHPTRAGYQVFLGQEIALLNALASLI